MLGKTIPEYIFIRAAISGLRLIAPLSALCVAWTLLVPASIPTYLDSKWTLFYSCGRVYATLEVAFFVCVYLPRRYHLQKARTFVRVVGRRCILLICPLLGGEPSATVPQGTPSTFPEML